MTKSHSRPTRLRFRDADDVLPLTPGRCPRIAPGHLVALCFIALFAWTDRLHAAESLWKAGAAKAVITPKQAIWMAGYASRTSPANGTLHELYVRALALEDVQGHRAVIVSTDLLG